LAFEGAGVKSIDLSKTKLTEISYGAFAGCESLKTVALPEFLNKIGQMAFFGTGFKEITIPPLVSFISNNAFAHTKQLTTIDLSNTNVKEIHNSAFACDDTTVLTSVTLPRTLTRVGEEIFQYCVNLTEIKISKRQVDYNLIRTWDGDFEFSLEFLLYHVGIFYPETDYYHREIGFDNFGRPINDVPEGQVQLVVVDYESGSTGTSGATGARRTSAESYQPCAGKSDGDICTMCDPSASDCVDSQFRTCTQSLCIADEYVPTDTTGVGAFVKTAMAASAETKLAVKKAWIESDGCKAETLTNSE